MPRASYPTIEVPTTSGGGRVFMDGRCFDATWTKSRSLADYEILVTLSDGRDSPISDTDDRFGFVYRAPDSGSQMSFCMVILQPGEPDPVDMPTDAELAATAFNDMGPLLASVASQRTDPDDIDFCRQVFSCSAAMLRPIQKHGSVQAARADILKTVFNL